MTYKEKKEQDERIEELVETFDLTKKSRKNKHKWNRYALMRHLRELGYTYQSIGDFLNRNHATIISGIRRYYEMQDTLDTEFLASIYEIEENLRMLYLRPVWFVREKKKENVFLTLINSIFEAKEMDDVEEIKTFINENINPNKL